MSTFYKGRGNKSLNREEGIFNIQVEEETRRNMAISPLLALSQQPSQHMAVATSWAVLLPITGCVKIGREQEKGRSIEELPEELEVCGGKEAAMLEGWGICKRNWVEQIMQGKTPS